MNAVPKKVLDLPLEERALMALRAAVKKAIADHLREGLPVYVWSNGRVVDLSVREIRKNSRPPSKRMAQNRKRLS